jgi:hypothetical protein
MADRFENDLERLKKKGKMTSFGDLCIFSSGASDE